MATQYNDVQVVCPFFIAQQDRIIKCEGVNDNNTIVLKFKDTASLNEYKEQFCDSCYQKCRVCKMLGEKYE